MSFKGANGEAVLFDIDDAERAFENFESEAATLTDSARYELEGSARFMKATRVQVLRISSRLIWC